MSCFSVIISHGEYSIILITSWKLPLVNKDIKQPGRWLVTSLFLSFFLSVQPMTPRLFTFINQWYCAIHSPPESRELPINCKDITSMAFHLPGQSTLGIHHFYTFRKRVLNCRLWSTVTNDKVYFLLINCYRQICYTDLSPKKLLLYRVL